MTGPKEGTRIMLVAMPDEPSPLPPGSTGTVMFSADFGDWMQVVVQWDGGRALNLCVPPDIYKVMT